MKNEVTVINARCKEGQKKNGVDLGPLFISSRIDEKLDQTDIIFDDVFNGYQLLYDAINKNMDKFRLTIGGDHSIAVSTIQPLVEEYDDLLVIWVDAHADINTDTSSLSGNTHGMPLAALTGLMDNWYTPKTTKKLRFDQLVYVGIRDLDEAETLTLKENNITVCNDIDQLSKMMINKKVHVSLDIDGIDPEYMPSTGTAVNKGLSMDFVLQLLSETNKHNFISCDLVEYNPLIGTEEERKVTESNILKIIDVILDN